MYDQFKTSVLGQKLTTIQGVADPYGDQCVVLDWAYAAFLFPNISIYKTITTGNANTLFSNANPVYFQKIVNDVNDANQVPQQGDIMVFNATPQAGYTNQFVNPDGHTGVCDSASSSGYYLLEQNAPITGEAVNVSERAWKYDPCIGWLRPILSPQPAPTPTPAPAPTTQTITLPETTGPWHLYVPGYAGNLSHVLGLIEPEVLHEALTYPILASLGNGVYRIHSQDYGIGDLWTNGSDVIIS